MPGVRVPKDWWKSFFTGATGRLMFDEVRWARAKPEIDLLVRKAKLKPGMRVLDLACGTGRHSLELARRGYVVTGLDFATPFLAEAHLRARKARLLNRVQFVHADMRRLGGTFAPGTFDAVLSLFNSFGYFDDRRDDRRVLRAVAQVLKPGGRFVLNTLNLPGVMHRLSSIPRMMNQDGFFHWHEQDGEFFLDRASWNPRKRRTEAAWVVIDPRRRKVERYAFAQHAYSPAAYRRMLRPLGLRIESLWSMLGGRPFTPTSWHQTFVARKRMGPPRKN